MMSSDFKNCKTNAKKKKIKIQNKNNKQLKQTHRNTAYTVTGREYDLITAIAYNGNGIQWGRVVDMETNFKINTNASCVSFCIYTCVAMCKRLCGCDCCCHLC